MQTKNVGSQANDGAMRTRDTWHRNHAKHANADDLRSRPNKVAQINVRTLNIPTFILPDYTCGALAFVARGATPESFAAGGAHAPLCLLNFLGSSRTLGVVSRSA